MAVTTDIVESWRNPRSVVRRHLRRGRSEPFAFSLLFVFLLITFIAQFPRVARVSAMDPTIPISPQMLGVGLGLLATIPFLYALAALSSLGMRSLGAIVSGYGARIALFWSLVATSPLVLLVGLVAGMIGGGNQLILCGVLTFAAFVFQWIFALIEVKNQLQDVQ